MYYLEVQIWNCRIWRILCFWMSQNSLIKAYYKWENSIIDFRMTTHHAFNTTHQGIRTGWGYVVWYGMKTKNENTCSIHLPVIIINNQYLVLHVLQALNDAKQELRFLLVYLHGKDHQASEGFCRATLGSQEVIGFVNTSMLFWACDTNSPEGYRGIAVIQCC